MGPAPLSDAPRRGQSRVPDSECRTLLRLLLCVRRAPFKGYYSFDLGAWHLVALNSGCAEPIAEAPGCFAGSEQERWLRGDLQTHPARCTLAYWHHPRFSSAEGDNEVMRDVWKVLREFGVDLVLNGHAHVYERFAPQTADGAYDPSGVRELVVGTGGQKLIGLGSPHANSEVRFYAGGAPFPMAETRFDEPRSG